MKLGSNTARSIGATLVLAGVAVAGFLQVTGSDDSQPMPDLTVEPTRSEPLEVDENGSANLQTLAAEETESPFVYRIGVLSGISTDNYWAYYGEQPSVWNSYILGPTKPALFTVDAGDGAIQPELATEMATPTQGSDGWEVIIEFDEMYWSDGAPITAEDFVFTFETVRRTDMGGGWAESFPEELSKVELDDQRRLRLIFAERPTLAVWPYAVGFAPIMPAHAWSETADGKKAAEIYELSGSHDASGGPLTLTAWSENLVVSRANRGHKAKVEADRVQYHVLADEASAIEAMADGQIDVFLTPKGLTPDQTAAARGASLSLVVNQTNSVRYLGFNLAREPMSSSAFRRSIALLLDREEMAEDILGDGTAAWTFTPETNDQWLASDIADTSRELYEGTLSDRLDAAIEALEGEGYSWEERPKASGEGIDAGSGLRINGLAPQPLTILTAGDSYEPARPEYVEAIADLLRTLGFDARPVVTDLDTVIDLAFTEDDQGAYGYDMFVLGWTLGNPSLPTYYGPLFSTDGQLNNTGYDSPEFEAALEEFESAYDMTSALTAIAEMELILAKDLPYLPLYRAPITEVYRQEAVTFAFEQSLGGLQARLGAIGEVVPAG